MSNVRIFLTNASSSVVSRVLQLTVFVWVNQHLLKRVAPEEYSLFPTVVSLLFFAEVIKNIVTAGIARFIVEADSKGNNIQVTRIVSSMFPIVLGTAALLGFLGFMAVWQVEHLLRISPENLFQARLMLGLLVFLLCLNVAAAPFSEGAYIKQRFVTLNIIDLSCEALRIIILLVLLFAVSTKVMWLVVASTAAASVNLFVRILLTRRWVPAVRFSSSLISLKTAWPLIRFGGWTSVQGITGLVSSTAPILLLNRYGTPLDVAAFYLGRLPDIQIRGLVAVALAPAQPALTRIFAMQGEGVFTKLYYRGGRYHLWAVLLIVAPALMFAREIIELYAGEGYQIAATVILAYLGAYPFLYASGMFFQVAHAIGKIRCYYTCDIVLQSVAFAGLLGLVAFGGLSAASAAITIAVAAAAVHIFLLWPMGLRLVNGCWRTFTRQTLIPGIFPFLVACAVCFLFRTFVPVQSWFALALGTLTAMTLYLAVLLRFCLDPVDRQMVSGLSQKLRSRLGQLTTSAPYTPVGN